MGGDTEHSGVLVHVPSSSWLPEEGLGGAVFLMSL